MGRVQDKVAIITGAGSGVGRACLEKFAAEGAQVVGAGRTLSKLEKARDELASRRLESAIVEADLSREEHVARLVETTLETHGRIDILVHAAGVGYSWAETSPDSMNDVVNTPLEKWREVLAINLDSCFLLARAVIPSMIDRGGGAIVNVSSISGMLGLQAGHTYTAAKAGMINLTRSLCTAYAPQGIRANCIAPGFIDTPMVASAIGVFDDPATAEQVAPMRRPGTPEEIANGCLFLASDEASYCNGSVLVMDGGSSARQ